MADPGLIPLCAAGALVDGGSAHRFELPAGGSAFAVRHRGQVRAYRNRCAHVALELDWLPGQVFDADGEFLLCAAHGALYEPGSGRCAGGACAGRGGLQPLAVVEEGGVVYWRP